MGVIQYPSVTSPPPLTPPTVDQAGWHPSLSDDPRIGRRATSFAAYPSEAFVELVPVAATVVSPWSSYPDTTSRPALSTANTVEFEYLFVTEIDVPVESWVGSYPDTTLRLALSAAQHPPLVEGQAVAQLAPTLGWGATNPDQTRRAALPVPLVPSVFQGESVEQFQPTLQAGVELPDDPRLGRRPVSYALYPWLSQDPIAIAPPAFAQPPFALYPDTTSRAALSIGNLVEFEYAFVTEIDVPVESWTGCYPDTTRRLWIPPSLIPFSFQGQSFENAAPTLLPGVELPDDPMLGRRRLSYATYPFEVRPEVLATPAVLLWSATYPDTTRRNSLLTGDMPSLFKGEAVEQFKPTLLWGAENPETTRRLSLLTAHIPTLFQGESVEQFAIKGIGWHGYQPDTTSRLVLGIAEHQTLAYQLPLVFVEPLSWHPTYPDMTSRAALHVSRYPFVVASEPLQLFVKTLLWSATYPNTTSRLAYPTPEQLAEVFQYPIAIGPPLSWLGVYPDTTRRAVFLTAAIPEGRIVVTQVQRFQIAWATGSNRVIGFGLEPE